MGDSVGVGLIVGVGLGDSVGVGVGVGVDVGVEGIGVLVGVAIAESPRTFAFDFLKAMLQTNILAKMRISTIEISFCIL